MAALHENQIDSYFRESRTALDRNFCVLDTGAHFNLPGHSVSDLSATVLERVKINDISYRKEREKYLINHFNTYYQGINRQA